MLYEEALVRKAKKEAKEKAQNSKTYEKVVNSNSQKLVLQKFLKEFNACVSSVVSNGSGDDQLE